MGFLNGLSSLFGGTTQSQTQSQNVYGPQNDFLSGSYFPQLGQVFGKYAQNPQDLISPFNQTQLAGQGLGAQTAFNQMFGGIRNSGFTGGGIPQGMPQGGAIGEANQALSSALDPNSGFNSGLFQNVLQSQLNPYIRSFQSQLLPMAQQFNSSIGQSLRDYTQNALPGIRSEAVGVGQAGSSREGIAQGLAAQRFGDVLENASMGLNNAYGNLTGGFADSLGRITSEMGQNAFNQGISQRLGALGLAPSIGQYNYLPSQMLQQIGGQQQSQDQMMRNAPLSFLQQMQSLAGPPTVLSSSYSQERERPNIFGSLFNPF